MKEYVEISKLEVDYSYQRELDVRRAKKIAADFMPELMGIITVSKRDNGKYYIVDGNHRVTAARLAGLNAVYAEIIEGLSAEEEANLFNRLNTSQKKPSYNENLKASIQAGNAKAVHYRDVLDLSGIQYDFNNGHGKDFIFAAHYSGMWALNTFGDKILLTTLVAIKESGNRPDSRLIRGVSRFLTYPEVDLDRLMRVLGTTPFSDLLRATLSFNYSSDGWGSDSGKPMAKSIATFYNKNLRSNRIDLAFFDK